MNAVTPGCGHRPSNRRRGAALVLVLIFGVGALTLIMTLISLSEKGARDEHESHRIKTLHAVLRAGIASAVNEVNRDRLSGPYDPAGDGVGALLGPLVGTVRNGIPVTTSSGQVLGRYRCTIKDVGGRLVLTVVAAWPDFVNPRRQLVAAQGEIDPGTPGFLRDRNALSFIGPSVDEAEFEFEGSLSAIDPTFQVPAVNAADAGVHAAFTAAAAGQTIVGADPNDPGSSASGATTITNTPAGVVNTATVNDMITGIDQYVTAQLPTAIPIESAAAAQGATVSVDGDGDVSIRITGGGTGITLPFGVYKVNELDLDQGTLNGSGTLIITEEFEVENGARINWDGNVIIIGSNDAELELENGSRASINGTLAVIGVDGEEAEMEVESGGRLDVTGAMLVFGMGAEGELEFELDSGSRANITGVVVLLGNEVELEIDSGTRLNVDGSMIIGTPFDAAEGEIEFEIGNGAQANFTFNNANFEMALDRLKVFANLTGLDEVLPVSVDSYWEEGGVNLASEQDQDIVDGNVAITP